MANLMCMSPGLEQCSKGLRGQLQQARSQQQQQRWESQRLPLWQQPAPGSRQARRAFCCWCPSCWGPMERCHLGPLPGIKALILLTLVWRQVYIHRLRNHLAEI